MTMPSAKKQTAAFCLSWVLAVLFVVSVSTLAIAQYQRVDLVSDQTGLARNTDPNLRNGWGLAFFPNGPFWVADNTTGLSTLYDHSGNTLPLVVTVPVAPTNPFLGPIGSPTGLVTNPTSGFVVSANSHSGPALFLFDTEDGTISGWNPNVDATNSIVAVDNSASFAVYTGLAIATIDDDTFIYAADTFNNKIDVFDSRFKPVTLRPNAFVDTTVPAGMTAYNIQNIHGKLYVTYAVPFFTGQSFQGGVVDVFTADGKLLKRLTRNGPTGPLQAPWGLVIAPEDFGPASNKLLVGNLDDGHISVFNPRTGAFLGQLKDRNGNTIAIDGLWALVFGAGSAANGKRNELFYTAGPNFYADGLFGVILSPEED
jgi:uncharacterized protein (TIGR03118 family)